MKGFICRTVYTCLVLPSADAAIRAQWFELARRVEPAVPEQLLWSLRFEHHPSGLMAWTEVAVCDASSASLAAASVDTRFTPDLARRESGIEIYEDRVVYRRQRCLLAVAHAIAKKVKG